jgi:hypothetical protein
MNIKMLKVAVVGLVLSVSGFANAVLITEATDAGETMATAFNLTGGVTSINGTISNDVDVFRFSLASNTVFTISAITSNFDMNLLIFNGLGQGIAGNDDLNRDGGCGIGLGSLDSCLTLSLSAGDFFFAIGDNNTGAYDALGSQIMHNDSGILASPTAASFASFYHGSRSGSYTVNFSTATSSPDPVPEPSILAIFALGIMGLVSRRLKKQ